MRNDPAESTVPRRQIGRRLRELREGAYLTRRLVANELYISEATLWRIERGLNAIKPVDAEKLCQLYEAPDDTTEYIVALAALSVRKSWWFRNSDTSSIRRELYQEMHVELERRAFHHLRFGPSIIPALLQTPAYTRALLAAHNPNWPPARIDHHLRLHLPRQEQVACPRVRISAVIDESVLHRPIGCTEVFSVQLHHLYRLAQQPNVSLRVVPFGAGYHHGLRSGAFTILDFPVDTNGKLTEAPVVHLETLTGTAYLEEPEEVEKHRAAFHAISAAALNEHDTRRLLEKTIEGIEGTHV